MADLKIVESSVSSLGKGFKNIRNKLDLVGSDDMRPTSDNVGYSKIINAIEDFNQQVSETKNKYKRKTENLVDFLENVKTGSDEVDKKIASALTVKKP